MNTNFKDGAHQPRMNPFLFPSDTDLRFALLILSVLCAVLYISQHLFINLSVTPMLGRIGDTYTTCATAQLQMIDERQQGLLNATSGLLTNLFATGTFEPMESSRFDTSTPYTSCIKNYLHLEAFWMLGWVLLVLSLSFIFYWREPLRIIRREKLEPLPPDDVPEVTEALSEMLQEVNLKHPPAFVWNPLHPALSGMAFGRLNNYYVSLSGGLVTQCLMDLPGFRAILRHELAHLKNGDVDKTYFVLALWKSFVIVGLIPFFLSLVLGLILARSHYVPFILGSILATGFLTALVFLSRNSVLRVREAYADVRASVWDRTDGRLVEMVSKLPESPRSFWKRVLQVHPQPADRIQSIQDPGSLMRMDFWMVFGMGLAATITYSGLSTFFYNILPLELEYQNASYAATIFGYVVSIFAGLIIWRNTFAARVQNKGRLRVWRLSLGLTLGLAMGQFVSFDSGLDYLLASSLEIGVVNLWAGLLNLIFFALWLVFFWLFIYLIFQWQAHVSGLWVETVHSPKGLLAATISNLVILGFIVSYFTGWFLDVQNYSTLFGWPVATLLFAGFMMKGFAATFTLLIPLGLILFPMAAVFWQKTGPSSLGWAYLEQPSLGFTLKKQITLRPAFAIWMGIGAGVAYTLLYLLLRIFLYFVVPEATRSTDLYKMILFDGSVLLAGIMQMLVGLILYSRTRHLQVEHATLAALAGGLVMAAGFLVVSMLWGSMIDATFILQTFNSSIKTGFGLTLVAVLAFLGFTVGLQSLTRPLPR